MSRNVIGVAITTPASTISSRPYSRSGERTRSATWPPISEPIAIPPKNPVRIADTAWVVFPNTSTGGRDQTISSMSPAAPDRMKISRISSGTVAARELTVERSDAIRPVPPDEHDDDAEDDQDPPA